MAVQFPQAPTYADPVIVDERTGKSRFNEIWLRWFLDVTQLFTSAGGGGGGAFDHELLTGLQGGTMSEYYHLTGTQHSELVNAKSANTFYAGPTVGAPAIPAFRALVPADLPGGSGLVAGRIVYTDGSANLTTSADLLFDGTTLTQGYGLVTINSNVVATRAAGAAAAGITNAVNNVFSYSADSGGTTDYRGGLDQITLTGSNASHALVMHRNEAIHGGSNTVSTVQALRGVIQSTSSGNMINPAVSVNTIVLSSTGVVTGTADAFLANTPTTNGGGCIPVYNSFRANLGGLTVGHITEANGFTVEASTGPTLNYAFRGKNTTGTGRYNLGMTGSAMNLLVGNTRVGGSTDPTVALDVTGSVIISDNLTVGDASADTLTVNAGTWAFNNNFTATRAAGTVAAGVVTGQTWNSSFAGDSGGTTDFRGQRFDTTSSGSNNISVVISSLSSLTNTSSGTIGTAQGERFFFNQSSGGGIVTTLDGFSVAAPAVSSGSVTTFNGFRVANIGAAAIGTVNGVLVADQASATTAMNGITLQLSSGSGKKNLNITGNAMNVLVGNTRIGGSTDPTVALDVTGAIAATTTIKPGGYTVATLPAGIIGMKAYVTDALAPAFLTTLVGGGAAYSGAQYNGANWVAD